MVGEDDAGPSPQALAFLFSICYIVSMKEISYSKQAFKTLARMTPADSRRIRSAVTQYATDGKGDVKKLQGFPFYRLRVGDWRVIFDDDGLVITVEKIAPRGDVYKEG